MAAPKGPMGRGARRPFNKDSLKVLPKLIKYLFHYYKLPLIVVFVCLVFASIAGSFNSYFLKEIIDRTILRELIFNLKITKFWQVYFLSNLCFHI